MKISKRSIFGIFRRINNFAEKSKKAGDPRSQIEIIRDMVLLRLKYDISLDEYVKYGIGIKSRDEREQTIASLNNKHRWDDEYDDNWRFLSKYSGIEWQKNTKTRTKRTQAYIKRYNMGPHCKVQYGVTFIAEHYNNGKLNIGDHVHFARDVDIDFTGDLTIGNGVSFAEGCKVLTHNHDFFGIFDDTELIPFSSRAHNTPLTIKDNVLIGARSIIMSDVTEIGENAIVSAGSVVTKPVPANCVVSGNPAQIINKISPKARIYFNHS